MVPVLNECNVDCAVFGNHDFGMLISHPVRSADVVFFILSDYGLDNLIDIAKRTKFPWLMSNVLDIETGRPLGEGKVSHVIEKNGIKV